MGGMKEREQEERRMKRWNTWEERMNGFVWGIKISFNIVLEEVG